MRGHPRWSTLVLVLVFVGALVLYFAVRPEPANEADEAPTLAERAEEIVRYLSTTSTSTPPASTTTMATDASSTEPNPASVPPATSDSPPSSDPDPATTPAPAGPSTSSPPSTSPTGGP